MGFPLRSRGSRGIRGPSVLCSGIWKSVFQRIRANSHSWLTDPPWKGPSTEGTDKQKTRILQKRNAGSLRGISWCRRRDSNSHSFRHYPLKIACLPISPRRLDQPNKANPAGKSSILSRNLESGKAVPLYLQGGGLQPIQPGQLQAATASTPSACRHAASDRACVASYSASSSITGAPSAASNAAWLAFCAYSACALSPRFD